MTMIGMTHTDMLHIAAFRAVYKEMRKDGLCQEAHFAEAIVRTSDEVLKEQLKNPIRRAKMEEWLRDYVEPRKRKENNNEHTLV